MKYIVYDTYHGKRVYDKPFFSKEEAEAAVEDICSSTSYGQEEYEYCLTCYEIREDNNDYGSNI